MGVHAAGTQHGLAYRMAPLEGKRAPVLVALLSRAPAAHVPFGPLQELIWQIMGGLSYSELPPQSQQLVDQLIPEFRNKINEDFVDSLQKSAHKLDPVCNYVPALCKASSGFDSLIQRYQQTQQNLRQYANNYEALARSMVNVLPGTAENAGPSSWSRVNPRVYVRLADGNVYGQMGHLEIRVLPSDARIASAPPHSGNLQAASFRLAAADSISDLGGDLADVPLQAMIAYPNANMQGLGWGPISTNSPVITNVSTVLPQANQTITITGSGFGTQAAYNGDSPYIEIGDLSGNWYAGHPGNWVTLNVQSWTDTQIVLSGLSGRYGMAGTNWTLQPGDQIQIQVWNGQSGIGPALYDSMVQMRPLVLGAYLGDTPTAKMIAGFELDSGTRHLDLVNIFIDWKTSFADITGQLTTIESNGSMPMITWDPTDTCNAAITGGGWDPYIKTFAKGVADFGSDLLIRPMHEMNLLENKNPAAWALVNSTCQNTGETFQAAWRHLMDLFRNAKNAKFVWCVNNKGVPASIKFSDAYPGDGYVDYVGIDGYNWGYSDPKYNPYGSWQSFAQVFQDAYGEVSKFSSKPIVIAEWASAPSPGNEADWIKDAFAQLQQPAFCRVVGAIWFNVYKERNWTIESGPSTQQAYAEAARATPGPLSGYATSCAGLTSSSPFSSHTLTPKGIPINSVPAATTVSARIIISSVSPSQGPAGTAITISGAGFKNVTAVTFGDIPTAYTVVSPTMIKATVPDVSYADSTIKTLGPGSQVGITVAVVTASGSANSLFNYTGPVALTWTPNGEARRTPSLERVGAAKTRSVVKGDIHSVDFRNFEYHSDALGKTLRIKDGQWTDPASGDYFGVFKVAYGDLTGDGKEEAVVWTESAPGGVSPNIHQAEVFVFSMSPSGPTLLESLSSSDASHGEQVDWGRLTGVQVSNLQLAVSYSEGKCNACNDWLITAKFRWNGSRFVKVGAERKPFTGSPRQ